VTWMNDDVTFAVGVAAGLTFAGYTCQACGAASWINAGAWIQCGVCDYPFDAAELAELLSQRYRAD
jgi:hypothetical protein